jgi:hypothetical protein
MGLLGDMFKGIRMKDPVRGQAQVVSCSAHRGEGSWENCSMQLVVQAEGVPATSTRKSDMVRADRWPTPGMTLPVTVDRAKPERLKIEWGEIESSQDRGERTADAMAAMMRGEAPPAGLGAGNVQVVNASGTDPRLLPEEKKAKLRMLGIDPDQLAVQQGFGPAPAQQPPQAAASDSDDEVDDQLARLAKLGQLRDAGVLTPAEFEEQKRRILEG